jgi:hypothetical protein
MVIGSEVIPKSRSTRKELILIAFRVKPYGSLYYKDILDASSWLRRKAEGLQAVPEKIEETDIERRFQRLKLRTSYMLAITPAATA